MEWFIGFVIIVGIIMFFNHQMAKARRNRLMEKYNDEQLVEKLMDKQFWQGQSHEQLIDSLGEPLDIDQKVMKTKTKETWKYQETGKNRYALKIVLENNEVVGWDKK